VEDFPGCTPQTSLVSWVTGPRETVGQFGCDFDYDGFSDAVFINQLDGNVSIYWGNAAGTLGTPTTISTGRLGGWGGCGDFNDDGRGDLVITRQDAGNLNIYLSSGGRTFGGAINYTGLSFPNRITVGDINRDGREDLLVSTGGTSGVGPTATQTWQLRPGAAGGTFGSPITAFSGPNGAHRFGDLDGDGFLEAATLTGTTLAAFTLGTTGALTSIGTYSLTGCSAPGGWLLHDVDGDARSDLVVECSGTLQVHFHLGALAFSPCSLAAIPLRCGSAEASACWLGDALDFNGDNRLDSINSYTCGSCSSRHYLVRGAP